MGKHKHKTLKDVMPPEFLGVEFDTTRAYKMRDVEVSKEHFTGNWPGNHKNVYFWVELKNGFAVGWNENPGRGWSFPVMKLKRK